MKQVIAIIGPTASGKTNLSLALAKELKADIISLDSMQIYQKLDIGTAKASVEERKTIQHHLIDIVAANVNYSIADFLKDYTDTVNELEAKKQPYILAGGSLQYLLALWREDNYTDSIAEDAEYRANLQASYQDYAKDSDDNSQNPVYLKLCEVDLKRAQQVHPNDMKRIIRALEICKTGCLASEKDPRNLEKSKNDNYLLFAYNWPREVLYQRINQRVDLMLKAGLLEEAKWVYINRENLSTSCLQAIGYKEFFPYFQAEISLETAINQLKLNSRHYAKRQLSIMRKLPINYLDPQTGIASQLNFIRQSL
ncbi:tRNA (adenosine(37)-N6)-dimethylallyltransferase MiaA [Amygdalobacter nucleatus]|uniref:tRNA dimethylallyltransferase n=1 Tax=Amygdalobacter nucleatus TaxID=3029274 RepID=A0A133Y6A8_9FIRM|nr:tRNA (adenosine(37)-N6)-dimethylallyltransferase MiaA [Amygdalobacter nucleatus]KXB38744.1 tRNA dimethylallyltransferase [Amygdalobacter nucleatus]MDF0485956.1 tRNA (adenosine(37)-N6)-dimethylallyltransferase MiaA [Amygdalobacter nucleatus]